IDTNTDGTYTVHYNASDLSGNAGVEVTRTIIVGTGVTPPPPEPPAEPPAEEPLP
nr:DUF5011 domain-containing protein [Candidatus Paceibacterota bacterium]